MSERGRQPRQSQREVGRGCAAGFEPEEGASIQGVQVDSRSWKSKETDFSPEPTGEIWPAYTLIFAQ